MVDAKWELADPSVVGRPRRRLYKLTGEGARVGRQMVADYKPRVRPSRSWPGWLPGPTGEPT